MKMMKSEKIEKKKRKRWEEYEVIVEKKKEEKEKEKDDDGWTSTFVVKENENEKEKHFPWKERKSFASTFDAQRQEIDWRVFEDREDPKDPVQYQRDSPSLESSSSSSFRSSFQALCPSFAALAKEEIEQEPFPLLIDHDSYTQKQKEMMKKRKRKR